MEVFTSIRRAQAPPLYGLASVHCQTSDHFVDPVWIELRISHTICFIPKIIVCCESTVTFRCFHHLFSDSFWLLLLFWLFLRWLMENWLPSCPRWSSLPPRTFSAAVCVERKASSASSATRDRSSTPSRRTPPAGRTVKQSWLICRASFSYKVKMSFTTHIMSAWTFMNVNPSLLNLFVPCEAEAAVCQ